MDDRGTQGIVKKAAEWNKPNFVIGETRFRIEKLLPMRAFDVMEMIRVAIGGSIEGDSDNMMAFIVRVVLSIPREKLKEIRDSLFEQVYFRNKQVKTETAVFGMEEMAFNGLEPSSVYRVLVSAVLVNFRESFPAELFKVSGIDQD